MDINRPLRALLKWMMRGVRLVLSILPQPLRKLLRHQHRLMSIYSKALHSSRMFYGTISPKQQQARYLKLIKRQQQQLEEHDRQLLPDSSVDCLVLNPSEQHLPTETITSLLATRRIRKIYLFNSHQALDSRFQQVSDKVILLPKNGFIDADVPLILLRDGEYIHEQGISLFIQSCQQAQKDCVVTCDSDVLLEDGGRTLPECYPQWNPDLQLSSAYINSGICISGRALQDSLIGLLLDVRHEFSYALWLVQLYIMQPQILIKHLPFTLLHRALLYKVDWSKVLKESRILEQANGQVLPGKHKDTAVVHWSMPSIPLVSIIIPTRNAKSLVETCITSILTRSRYKNFEILLVDNNSDDKEALDFFDALVLREPQVRLIRYPYEFNYSAINNFAVTNAKGAVYAFVNNDIEVISETWLDDMVQNVMRSDIGCVGAKLYYPNRRVQHAGVVLGYGGGAGHAHKFFPDYHPGYLKRLVVNNNFSAVTAACLLIKKQDFEAVKGFNETVLKVAFNDVDLCLKVLALGKRNLYCASAELYHHESISRGTENTPEKRKRFEQELEYLQLTWRDYIANDPAYNPNLTLKQENFALREN